MKRDDPHCQTRMTTWQASRQLLGFLVSFSVTSVDRRNNRMTRRSSAVRKRRCIGQSAGWMEPFLFPFTALFVDFTFRREGGLANEGLKLTSRVVKCPARSRVVVCCLRRVTNARPS